jgi:hypothetical protein
MWCATLQYDKRTIESINKSKPIYCYYRSKETPPFQLFPSTRAPPVHFSRRRFDEPHVPDLMHRTLDHFGGQKSSFSPKMSRLEQNPTSTCDSVERGADGPRHPPRLPITERQLSRLKSSMQALGRDIIILRSVWFIEPCLRPDPNIRRCTETDSGWVWNACLPTWLTNC